MRSFSPLAAGLAGALALGIFVPAFAADQADALQICKAEVTARYGDQAQTKLKRIRSRGDTTKVSLIVRGVSDKRFKVDCRVDDNLKISGFVDNRAEVASR